MIKQYSWKHIGVASVLTIAVCVGFFLYSQWDITRFRESLEENTTQSPQILQTDQVTSTETHQQTTKSTTSESYSKNKEIKVGDYEVKDEKEADFYDFLDFIDQLEEEEVAKLIENLDLEEDEKKAIADLTQQESDVSEDIHPSNMIVDLMESGVASLADLIEVMEESKNVMPEDIQQKFEPVLHTLREMQQNGGSLIFHRPPGAGGNYMLVFINPSPGQYANIPLDKRDNLIHEIPSHDPDKESLFLHKGNSIIID